MSQGVPTIYMGKSEISIRNSNGLRHSIWFASENMGFDLRWWNFTALADMDMF